VSNSKTVTKELQQLDHILKNARHLLIVTHNNPDPDAIASAMALQYLVEKRCGVKSSIAYGGNVGRSENRAMLRLLKVHMKQFNRLRLDKYDRFALVDTQQGMGNNSFPAKRHCHVVIDHHPLQKEREADLTVIHPDIGVSATLLIEWLQESEIEIPADLATALSYAIISETQDLGREAGARDIKAYLSIYVNSSMRKLSQILNPKLPHSYFISLGKTLKHTFIYRNLICAHLGDIPSAETVSEMADFLLRHQNISWSCCTGRLKKSLIISLRTINQKGNAGKLIKKLVDDPKTVGGHDMLAGGYIELPDNRKGTALALEKELTDSFAGQLGHKQANWKPLVDIETKFGTTFDRSKKSKR
jgi:nanoRNase/pAp phosphatase (c-di-AMP/oligoRNAs hydrolase)